MARSMLEVVAPSQIKSPATAKVNLIAWDPESPAHTERMVQQRIACGWKWEYVEQWRVLQRQGKIALQWVVLSEEDPGKDPKLARHLLEHPAEVAPILDSATALGGKPRIPSSKSFIPVGHISLDAESPNPGQADASKGIYCITTFYISRAVQRGGIGRATMDAIESEAVNEPLYAKILSLDTFANEGANRSEIWSEIGMKRPSFSNQDWYERRGYKVWRFVEGHIQHPDPAGKLWPLNAVFMKKTVA